MPHIAPADVTAGAALVAFFLVMRKREKWMAWFCGITFIVAIGIAIFEKETPIRDRAMNLVSSLDKFTSDLAAKHPKKNEQIAEFMTGNYEHEIIAVHDELSNKSRRSDTLDDIADKFRRGEDYGLLNGNDGPIVVILMVRNEVKKLATNLKE
ncbi:MAG: hypothetical protein ACLQU4_20290 [Limisphaerales bacterium]